MRRSTGAILRETRPETIITSAWRASARKTSEPKRARSWRESVVAIISMAQQARPKVAGHKLDLRAQLTRESSRVVMISGNASAILFSRPIKTPLRLTHQPTESGMDRIDKINEKRKGRLLPLT